MIRCGHCQDKHETVAEVRACAAEHGNQTAAVQDKERYLSMSQQRYLMDLLGQFNLELADGQDVPTADYKVAHPILDKLIVARRDKMAGRPYSLPAGVVQLPHAKNSAGERKPSHRFPGQKTPQVPQGYYATKSRTGHNDLDFWFVKEGTRNPEVRFVRRIVGGQPPIRIGRVEAREALEAIARAGVEESGKLYAEEMDACWKCNISLTRKASREVKMGQHCADKNGMGEVWRELDAKYDHV